MENHLKSVLAMVEEIKEKAHGVEYQKGSMSLHFKEETGGIITLSSGNNSAYLPISQAPGKSDLAVFKEDVMPAIAKVIGKKHVPVGPWEFKLVAA